MDDNLWKGSRPGATPNLYGVIREENSSHPGVYRFKSFSGIDIADAHVLTPDADIAGGGQISKPRPGSPCVCIMSDGGAFIVGFHRAPVFDDNSDEAPSVGDPDEISTSEDKIFKTAGGATLHLKRGGAVIIEGGSGTGIIMNPANNQMSVRSTNFRQNADGYLSRRGRKEIGKTDPETVHTEEFLNQVGPSYDQFRIEHGDLDNDGRRQLSLASIVVAAGQGTATIKTQETYYSDGSWVGEGPKYQWGGASANEPAVLGLQLVEAMETLIDIVKNLKVNTAWGPSTPPIPPTPIDLERLKSELSGKILSTFLFFSKDPVDLG